MSKNNQQKNNKGFLAKTAPSLEFYDASAMFITQFILQYLLQLIMMILGIMIIADSLGAQMTTGDGYNAVMEKFSLFTASSGGIALLTFLNESTMILSPLAYWKVKSFNVFKGIGFKRKVNAGQIALTFPIALTLLIGFMPIASLFVSLVQAMGYTGGADITVDSFPKLLLYLLFVAAIPAVCEEILHRGIIARAAAKYSYFIGIILSSTIFAFMHGSPVQLVHQFFVGVVCALVYYMSGSIWISMLVHFFNNAITLIFGYVYYLATGSSDMQIPWWGMLLMCVLGLCALFFSLWGMYKVCYAKKKAEEKNANLSSDVLQNKDVVYVGKKKPLKVFNEKIGYLFTSIEQIKQEREKQAQLQEQISEYSQEKKEVFQSLQQEKDVDLKKKNSRGVIFALVVVVAIWLINTIAGFAS